jgi:hypothetical protein
VIGADRPCERCRDIGSHVICLRQLEDECKESCLGHSYDSLIKSCDDSDDDNGLPLREVYYELDQLRQTKQQGCHLCSFIFHASSADSGGHGMICLRLKFRRWPPYVGDDVLTQPYHFILSADVQGASGSIEQSNLRGKCV